MEKIYCSIEFPRCRKLMDWALQYGLALVFVLDEELQRRLQLHHCTYRDNTSVAICIIPPINKCINAIRSRKTGWNQDQPTSWVLLIGFRFMPILHGMQFCWRLHMQLVHNFKIRCNFVSCKFEAERFIAIVTQPSYCKTTVALHSIKSDAVAKTLCRPILNLTSTPSKTWDLDRTHLPATHSAFFQ